MQELIAYFIENPTALYIAVGLFSLCIGSFLKNDGAGMAARLPNVSSS
jgi:hypothetical protein